MRKSGQAERGVKHVLVPAMVYDAISRAKAVGDLQTEYKLLRLAMELAVHTRKIRREEAAAMAAKVDGDADRDD